MRLLLLILLLFLAGQLAFKVVKKSKVKQEFTNTEKLQAATNQTLNKNIAQKSTNNSLEARTFSWEYKNQRYQIKLNFSEDLYQIYQSSPHFYQHSGDLSKDWLNDFYEIFLQPKPQDKLITALVKQLQQQAKANNLSNDELVELTISFVQSINYDGSKVNNKNRQVNYPYETLYRQSGVCSDKSVLAVMLLRNLGYGAAILIYPDKDHASVGVECSKEYALPGTNYCYAETTAFFPIGFIPKDFNQNGLVVVQKEATDLSQLEQVFSSTALGQLQIYQKTSGKVYQGIAGIHQSVDKLRNLKFFLNRLKPEIEALKLEEAKQSKIVNALSAELEAYQTAENYDSYNQLIPEYNSMVNQHNDLAGNYKLKIETYNNTVNIYSQTIEDLYVADN